MSLSPCHNLASTKSGEPTTPTLLFSVADCVFLTKRSILSVFFLVLGMSFLIGAAVARGDEGSATTTPTCTIIHLQFSDTDENEVQIEHFENGTCAVRWKGGMSDAYTELTVLGSIASGDPVYLAYSPAYGQVMGIGNKIFSLRSRGPQSRWIKVTDTYKQNPYN